MSYTLKHPIWFSNRPSFKDNPFGICPSSKFLYNENELQQFKDSCSLMSQALIRVSDDITEKGASLMAKKNSDSSYTDGNRIVIGMNPIRIEDELSVGMDIEIGLSCHESCHCAYTDFNNYDLSKVSMPIAHWIHNVYEDECIEEMLGLEQPQWMYFLDCILAHYFNEEKFMKDVRAINNLNVKIEIAQFMLLYMVRQSRLSSRFPKDWVDEFGPMLDEIYEKVIVNIENPKKFKYSPTKETIQATIDTLEILKKYVTLDEMNSKLRIPNKGMIGNSSTEGDPNNAKTDDRKCGSNGLYNPNTKKGRKKSNDSIEKRYDKAKEENIKDQGQRQKENSNTKSDPNFIKNGEGGEKEIGAEKPNQGDIVKYNKIKSRLTEEINIARNIIVKCNAKKIELANDDFNRNGQLINSQLVQAIQGVNCVYRRKAMKLTEDNNPRYALVIAIDESGSMSFASKNNSSPSAIATRLAITFYEAMKDYEGIDIFIYGHGNNIVKYASPRDNKPERLANRKEQYGQNEEISYNTIVKDVRMQTKKPILLLNITDSGYLSNVSTLKNCIEELKKDKVTTMVVCVENSYVAESDAYNDAIYGSEHWVKVNDTNMKSQLKKLAKIMQTKYKKMK